MRSAEEDPFGLVAVTLEGPLKLPPYVLLCVKGRTRACPVAGVAVVFMSYFLLVDRRASRVAAPACCRATIVERS